MLLIIDLDYTLLDTSAFKARLATELGAYGVTSEQFWETFGMIAGVSDRTSYSIARHAQVLHEQTGIDAEDAQRGLEAAFGALPGMLYPDTPVFLALLREQGVPAVLFTFGDSAFQEQKVRAALIEPYFRSHVYTEESKHLIELAFPEPEDEWVFINDNPTELRALAQRYPGARMIRIRRPDGKTFAPEDDALDVPTFPSLDEVRTHLGL